jgi:NAD(P)-dependent dehydrogenase (short-subunit alcohol dehydrogenase family)
MLTHGAVSLEGKVAVVTGGGGGIGRGIAECFAAFGARVVVAERDGSRAEETVRAIAGRSGVALACVVDVQERADVARLAETTLRELGRIDVLVNNVGDFLGIAKPFVRTSEAEWEALYRINLEHVFRCCHAFVPRMIEQGSGGSIVNVSTIEAFRGIPGCAVYSAFNAGITGFTKSLALELGPHRIRVNAIAPETTETLQVRPSEWIPEEKRHLVPYWTPLGRFGTPDDAAGCALFLASDLSAWVTGTTVHVDGGALAAGGFYRVPGGGWTNLPVVTGAGIGAGVGAP